MGDRVLYFPYIQVPQEPWFVRAVLYWDEVGTIVPHEFRDNREVLGSYTAQLIDAKLVTPVFPDQSQLWTVPNFAEGFLQIIARYPELAGRDGKKLVDDDVILSLKRRKRDTGGIICAGTGVRRVTPPQTTLIHGAKFAGNLAYLLESKGLARYVVGPEYASWYIVEKRTASLFMAYLAIVLGQLDEFRMSPLTDRLEPIATMSEPPKGFSRELAVADRLQLEAIEGVLPGPTTGVSAAELAEFKERHRDLLVRLRTRVETAIVHAFREPDLAIRRRSIELGKRELESEVNEIRARMQERRWPRVVFGTLCGAGAAAASFAAAATAGAAAPALLAVPALLHGIYTAFEGSPRQRELLDSPVAYAALAQDRLTGKRRISRPSWLRSRRGSDRDLAELEEQ